MRIQRFSDITVLQKVNTLYYLMWPAADLEMFKIVGHNGFPEKYRIEIEFDRPSYVSIPTEFSNAFEFRNATEEEKKDILFRFGVVSENVYMMDERKSVALFYHREAIKAFVAADSVIITIYNDYPEKSV